MEKSRIPLYFQLMQELIDKIDNEVYVEHEKLPSERELCTIYNMSRITIRQALQELERENYIYKMHGKGTFVAPKLYNQKLVKLYSFTEEMKKSGKIPSTKVLEFHEMVADERLASKMDIKPFEEVFQVIRLRLADDEPLMYETSYLPKKIFPNLTQKDVVEKPMYSVFLDDYQIQATKAFERFKATSVRSKEAVHLKMIENQPAMLITRSTYYENTLIEYTISIARGDKFDYTVELT
ncbi:GntR family transcriptional regulator [Sporosarcina sp. Marseille-Q4063]|uniref:GntR family transcriptional regulator n=1 Tax=Sporosarcina sp. Marseille-Q4063 TaxID=2810514 RepID=UPI001BAED5FA|nr:GntR family transcriptional regulator [Sporosarcina sp. Marseille-Q4063]QUW21528.1 GntR family transcriptional regulator [Sporosarcina sp. Marseille-Q4063]